MASKRSFSSLKGLSLGFRIGLVTHDATLLITEKPVPVLQTPGSSSSSLKSLIGMAVVRDVGLS